MTIEQEDVCCVPTCPNHNHSGQSHSFYFPFPASSHLLHQWMRIILDPHNSKVCSDHFASKDIVDGQESSLDDGKGQRVKLKEGAVPHFVLRKAMQTESTATLSSPTPVEETPAIPSISTPTEETPATPSIIPTPAEVTPATPSIATPAEGTKNSRKSPKRWSAARKPVAVGKGTEIAETAAVTASDDLAEDDRAADDEPGSDDEEQDVCTAGQVAVDGLPWVCRKCQLGFSVSEDLTRHLSTTHNVIVFPCEDCRKQFQTERNLKVHKKFCVKLGKIAAPNGKRNEQSMKVDSNHANISRKFASARIKIEQIGQSAQCEAHQAEPNNKFSCGKNNAMKSNQNSDVKKKQQVFQCEKCGKHMNTRWQYAYHVRRACPMIKSVAERPCKHKCETCGEGFRSKKKLADHSWVHYKMFKCQTCGKRYFLKPNFMRHLQTHLVQKAHVVKDTVMCETCGKTFWSGKLLEKHKAVHSEKPYKCETCGKTYRTDKSLKKHCTTHMEQYMCETCGKMFRNHSALRSHHICHNTERPHVCEICGMSFLLRSALVIHRRRHEGDKRYPCSMCDKAFYTRSSAKLHLMLHTGEKPWKCETCGKQFRLRQVLNKHVKIHAPKPHQCGTCEKRFATKEMLDMHQIDHEQTPALFTCKCGRGFTKKISFNRHQSYHSRAARTSVKSERTASVQRKKKMYKCARCGKVLTTQNGLTLHERTHTGEKPFVCTTCGKAFNNSTVLTYHLRTHTGEKPYKCIICEKGFRSSQLLTHHLIVHKKKRQTKADELIRPQMIKPDSPMKERKTRKWSDNIHAK